MDDQDPIYEYVIVESKKSVRKQMQREMFFAFSYALRQKTWFMWKCYRQSYHLYSILYSMFVYRKVVLMLIWLFLSRYGLLPQKI